jgi:hypothetical protein
MGLALWRSAASEGKKKKKKKEEKKKAMLRGGMCRVTEKDE